jgi:hypothetical protein
MAVDIYKDSFVAFRREVRETKEMFNIQCSMFN